MLQNSAALFGFQWNLCKDYAIENDSLNLETQQTELAKHKPQFVGVQ